MYAIFHTLRVVTTSNTIPPVYQAVMGTQLAFAGGANSLAKPHVSAMGTGGTSGAHSHKLRVMASTPGSY